MRGRSKFKRIEPVIESKYNDPIITKFINHLMWDGKKETARNIVYSALEKLAKEKNMTPPALLSLVIEKAAPILEVKARRVGGATYQVPMEVKPQRKVIIALKWIIDTCRNKQGKPMSEFLYEEMSNVLNSTGEVMKKREDVHKMAEANRAFAHFARF